MTRAIWTFTFFWFMIQFMLGIVFAGAFVGCSLQGSIVTTRVAENCRFYGSSSITASDILLGSLPKPPAAAILYQALTDLFQQLKKWTYSCKHSALHTAIRPISLCCAGRAACQMYSCVHSHCQVENLHSLPSCTETDAQIIVEFNYLRFMHQMQK